MTEEYCQKVRISAMAILDGEEPFLSAREIAKHAETCANCRQELEQQEQVLGLLNEQRRQSFTEDVCPRIAAAIHESAIRQTDPQQFCAFALLALILLVYKLVEVLPGFTAGVVVKLVPVATVIVFFTLLKENPIKINHNLRLQGDIGK